MGQDTQSATASYQVDKIDDAETLTVDCERVAAIHPGESRCLSTA